MRRAEALGEPTALVDLMNDFAERGRSLSDSYQNDLKSIGWQSLLDPTRLKNDVGLAATRTMIREARHTFEDYRGKMATFLDSMMGRARQLDAAGVLEPGVLKGVEAGRVRYNQRIDDATRLEEKKISEFEGICALLSSGRNWQVVDGKIRFSDDEDLRRYNSHIHAIQEDARQQQEISRSIQEDAKGRLKQLKEIIK